MSLQDFRPMQDRCSNCLSCKWIPYDKIKSMRFGENCPTICHYKFHNYSARGKFQLGQTLLDKDCEYTDEIVQSVHACLACGACDVSCKIARYNLEPYEHNIEIKNDAVLHGKLAPKQDKLLAALKEEQAMVLGAKKATRTAWAEGLGLKDASKEPCDVLFFAGCKYSYDASLRNTVRAGAKLLMDAGVKLGILGSAETCCAGRAWQMGSYDVFDKKADDNIALLKKTGVKTIVTPCSDCYYTFKRLYAKHGLQVEVLHIVECIERLIGSGKYKFTKTVNKTVTYHDPCHLGRLGEPYVKWEGKEKKILNQVHTWDPPRPRYNGVHGIYDAPRNILSAIPGIKFTEMERIREYSWCCGAGGCVDENYPALSESTACERITEANATGADALITACPRCRTRFAGVLDENGNAIEVIDIIDLVLSAI